MGKINFVRIFLIFFKTGLFTIGGGLAALPLIQEEAINRDWLTQGEFADIIAISQSTPGPIGINIATYVGYEQLGVFGAIIATLGMVIPSIIIICIVAKFLLHFNQNKYVQGAFYGVRPAVVGIIISAAYSIMTLTIFDFSKFQTIKKVYEVINIKEILLFFLLIILVKKTKFHPAIYIIIAGVIGAAIF